MDIGLRCALASSESSSTSTCHFWFHADARNIRTCIYNLIWNTTIPIQREQTFFGTNFVFFTHQSGITTSLLLNDGTEPSEVHVKGEQITSDSDFPDSDSQTNDLGINNNQFIHSFSFATIYRESSTSISATWNTQAGKGSYLYVIRVSHNGIRNISDEQIYSIEGAGLGNDTESFEYEKVLSGGLYLTVSQLLSDGSYKLIESTGIATD